MELINNMRSPLELPDTISADMKDLLRSLLQKNPDLRQVL